MKNTQNQIQAQEKKQKKKRKKYYKNILYWIGALLLLGALALVLSGIGKELHPPFDFQAEWQDAKLVNTANSAYEANSTSISSVQNTSNSANVNNLANNNAAQQGNSSQSNQYGSSDKKSKYSVIIDGCSKRINVLDKNFQVFAQNEVTGTDVDIDKITSADIVDKSIYLSATSLNSTGTSIAKEAIYKTNLYGEVEKTIYTVEQKSENQKYHISSINVQDDNLLFTYIDGSQISAYKVDLDNDQVEKIASISVNGSVYMASYNAYIQQFLYTNYFGEFFVVDKNAVVIKKLDAFNNINCSNLCLTNAGQSLIQDQLSNKVYTIDTNNKLSLVDYYIDATNNMELVSNQSMDDLDGKKLYADDSGYSIYIGQTTPFCPFYIVKIIARWLAIAYIAFIFVLAAIKFIKKQRKLYRKGLLRSTTVGICIFLAVLGVVCYYQAIMHQKAMDDSYSTLEQQANLSAQSIQDINTSDIEKLFNININEEPNDSMSYEELEKYHQKITNTITFATKVPDNQIKTLEEAGRNVFYMLFLYDKSSDNFVIASTSDKSYQQYNVTSQDVNNYLKNADDVLLTKQSGTDDNGQYICVAKNFYDNQGNIAGAYIYGMYDQYIDNQYIDFSKNIIQTLIIVCLVLYVVIVEATNMSKVLRKYKKRTKKHKTKAYLQLIRPMNFFLALSMGADSVLAVLISKNFLENADYYSFLEENSMTNLFAGIPITIACGALVCGIALFIYVEKQFSAKNIFVVSAAFLVISYLLTARSCSINSFELFILAKALSGFFSGLLRSLLYSLAASEKNETKRKPLMQSISRSTMPGTVLAVLVCSFLSGSYGNQAVYVFAAVSSVIFILMGALCIPRGLNLIEDKQQGFINGRNYTSTKSVTGARMTTNKIVKWLLSPQILVLIICVIIPYTAAKGYKSYFFPLYSSAAGMTSTQVSTIFAVATMVAFILIHPISDSMSGLQDRQKIINGLLAMGFIFVLFLANSRVEWAVVVMFLSILIGRTFGTAFRLSWMRVAEYNNYDVAQIQPYMYFIEEACNALQVVFFSVFSLFGSDFACVAFGVFCIIGAIIYGVVSYRSPMRNEWLLKHSNSHESFNNSSKPNN